MGGKVFTNKTTKENPAKRIPTRHLPQLEANVKDVFGYLFDKIDIVTSLAYLPKEDHGDIDFVVLGKKDSRMLLLELCETLSITTSKNGPMQHVLFLFSPQNEEPYFCQIDFIFAKNETNYDTIKYFYEKPLAFNSIIGHFARSMGYKFSTDGFFVHVTDKRKQNRYVKLTDDLEKSYELMQISNPDFNVIFKSPENFAKWIMSSPRFDSNNFRSNYNVKAHRDSYSDPFCEKTYLMLHTSNIISNVKSSKINFREDDFNIEESLKNEVNALGKDFYEDLMKKIEEWSNIEKQNFSGDALIKMGFKQGRIIGEILQSIEKEFPEGAEEEVIKDYILKKFA